jgi:hypothetical protein
MILLSTRSFLMTVYSSVFEFAARSCLGGKISCLVWKSLGKYGPGPNPWQFLIFQSKSKTLLAASLLQWTKRFSNSSSTWPDLWQQHKIWLAQHKALYFLWCTIYKKIYIYARKTLIYLKKTSRLLVFFRKIFFPARITNTSYKFSYLTSTGIVNI